MFGIAFALLALFAWGFGDFFIQRTTRRIGIWKALFFIGLTGFIVLLPFVYKDARIVIMRPDYLFVLSLATIVALFASLFDFEALKRGKIAVVEPIISLELLLTVALSVVLWKEKLQAIELILILITFFGIMLTIAVHFPHLHYHKRIFEKGVMLAGLGAIGMALTNFLVGVGSQTASPLFSIWFIFSFIALICFFYLLYKREAGNLLQEFKHNPKIIITQSTLDTLGWIFFALATTLIPISIATTFSESYVALAALLGIAVNREKLKPHQLIGIVLVLIGVVALSVLRGG